MLSTLAFSAVLTLSLPALGQNPFNEIPVNSWVYASLSDLQAAGVLEASDLKMPRPGETLVRVEAAFIIDNILRELSARSGIIMPEAIGVLDSVTLSSFIATLFGGDYSEVNGKLFILVKEFQPELGMLANSRRSGSEDANQVGIGIMGSDSVTIKGQEPDLVFVDIDAIAPADLSPQKKQGIVSPGQLSSLARHYFREIGLIEPTQKPVIRLPDEIELYAPLQIDRPQIAIDQHQSDAQLLAAAGLAGWQRYRPTLFSQKGLLTEDYSTLYFLGAEAKVLSGLTIGTLWIADQKLESNLGLSEDEGRIYKTLSGQLRLRPDFTLIGEYSQSAFNDPGADQDLLIKHDDVAARIGAIFHLGEVEVGADLRSTGQNYNPLFEKTDFTPNSSGYGLSLKYKNLTVETIRDKLQPGTDEESSRNRTTLQLNYSFAERAMFKAGYSFVDVDSVDPTQTDFVEKGETATIGVDVNLNNTKIEADLTLGWQVGENSVALLDTKKASAGIQWRLPWEVDLKLKADYEFSEENAKNLTTMVGLNYDFRENGSLLLGYQLINFGSETDEGETRAGAELSISF